MIVKVNGIEKKLKDGATLKDALAGEDYVPGTLVSIHLSTEKLVKQSEDFEIVTEKGTMVIHLDEGKDADAWRTMIPKMSELSMRWKTEKIDAFGSFPTDIKVNKVERMYRPYDCFFSLGGFDNHTTYFMIARKDHRGMYGAGDGRIGHITLGRHILNAFQEGDRIKEVRPLVSEESAENIVTTTDMKYKLDDGYSIDTCIKVRLDETSSESAEHLLILASKGYVNVKDSTGSFITCEDDMDITMSSESKAVRDVGTISVRCEGVGLGRIYFYRQRRQTIPAQNHLGDIVSGMSIAKLAKAGDKIEISTEPKRIITVGMTQKKAAEFLKSMGIKQKKTGETDDDAIVVEQIPERTMDAMKSGEVETFGVRKDKIHNVSLDRKKSGPTVHYFEKVTGLSHKPIGMMKVFFVYEGMPMIQFEGDADRGSVLYPGESFKKCKRGDLGVTNQVRPNAGMIGIRLEDSKEYGPTGEEGNGTNIFGRFEDDLDKFIKGLNDGDVVYITEVKQ